MYLYLREDLYKSDDGKPKSKANAGKAVAPKANAGKAVAPKADTGERRGGSYVARTQTGYDKDGSPQYRYFRTEEEYESYLSNKGKSKSARDLDKKVKKEHDDSTSDHNEGDKKSDKKSGLLSDTKKSLFLRIP